MMPSLIVFQLGYSHDLRPGVQKIAMKQIYSIILFVSGFRGGQKKELRNIFIPFEIYVKEKTNKKKTNKYFLGG
jgi:hypothetical protein